MLELVRVEEVLPYRRGWRGRPLEDWAALAQHCIGHVSAEVRRFRRRTTVEQVNGQIKEEFGGRHVRVRGPDKVRRHLMFGILALTVEQLMRLTL